MSQDEKTVGKLLRDARDERGLSIESIAKDICVRSSYLVAIEADDYDELPEKTFAVGFVRAYAMALKQDAKSIVAQFKEEYGIEETPLVLPVDTPLAQPRRRLPGWLSPLAGVVGVSLCWAMFGSSIVPFSLTADSDIIDRNTDVAQLQAVQASLPARTEEAQVTNADAAVVNDAVQLETVASGDTQLFVRPASLFSPAAIADQAIAGVGTSDVLLEAKEDSWLRLENADGTEIWSGVLREGQSYRPQFDGSALLSTTNAGGVTLTLGDQQHVALGGRGEVIEGVRLDQDRLLSSVSASTGGSR
ncbi:MULTISPECIES: helix-turn-helix domain-containing protein [Kordiimonas]|jgi:cytoskeletal protein RodZ|uniref:helix-turn-helix domain-containing protein n=1 Tax=Kordiimonas TaxID=288021 RepID=UPI002580D958|nr:helix-turn-helix domain-containing protein [Kordiimonas sp. UBA4487]